jgi:uncharacterized protein (DUF1330 family)
MNRLVRNVSIGLLGAALGATAMTALRAQATPPVYVVIDMSEITDADAMSKASANVSAPPTGYLVRTQKAAGLDGGAPPARFVIVAFDSEAKAKEWFNSPPVAAINAVRLKATKSRSFIVEGFSK